MGLLGCLRSSSSSVLRNGGPRLTVGTKHQSFCSMAGDEIFLEDIIQKGTLEQKKRCLKELLQAMAFKMRHGIAGGCMDPKKIPILDEVPRISRIADEYVIGRDPDYISSLGDLVDSFHQNDHMTPRDIIKYNDFKAYLPLLSNYKSRRHLVLLSGHPHLHTKMEEMSYLQAAREQLKYIPAIPNVPNPRWHFPLPQANQHQVPITAIKSPQTRLASWATAFKVVRGNRPVKIFETIKHASPGYHHVYYFRSVNKQTPYVDNNPIDEMNYYINVIKHIQDHGETVDLLFEMFPHIPLEMFKFHWCYDGHAMGTVDLEDILGLDRPWVRRRTPLHWEQAE